MLRLYRGHRRACCLHVECSGRTTEQYWRAGFYDLRHRQPGQHVNAMEYQSPNQSHRCDQSHQCDWHNLHRNTGLNAIQQILTGVLAVTKVAGGSDRENRERLRDQLRMVIAELLHHLDHARHTVFAECARDNGFL